MTARESSDLPTGRAHLAALAGPLAALADQVDRIDAWGRALAEVLDGGGRLLAAGNGGSAAHAQHLTAELVGRYRDERRALSALALHADTSSLTAITNDYGAPHAFARQVRAHGRPGDVLVVLSTSGRSPNVLEAVAAAHEAGLRTWALTGRAPNPLARACDDALCVDAPATATVQEVHQVVLHLLCAAVDAALATRTTGVPAKTTDPPRTPVRPPEAAPTSPAAAAPSPTPATPARRQASRGRRHRVVVVGDALLDRDVDGHAERLCPDAPAPVVDSPVARARPGGAGLAALLAAADGRPVTLVTALGGDPAGRQLAALLDHAGVEVVDVGLAGPTPQKIRVRADGRVLVRLDPGGRGPAAPGALTDPAREALAAAAAVLVSDYGRGLTADRGVRAAVAHAGRRVPVVWDPHPRGAEPVTGTRLVTPNRAEADRLVPEVTGASLAAVTARAESLLRRWGAGGVAVTLGGDGALLVGADGTPLAVPAPRVAAADACGAGDCFAAAAAAALADGELPTAAVDAAVAAASAFVAGGASQATGEDAHTWSGLDLASQEPGRADAGVPAHGGASVREVLTRVRARGGTVVTTGGCFDLLHAGHVQMLQAARALGDALVVCLNSDASVQRLKGPGRPLVPEQDRAAVLAGLACVDAVVTFDEDTPERLLSELRPDVWAKGADYAVADLPEAAVVRRWGGRAVVLPYARGRSTTGIIREAIQRAHT